MGSSVSSGVLWGSCVCVGSRLLRELAITHFIVFLISNLSMGDTGGSRGSGPPDIFWHPHSLFFSVFHIFYK